MTPSKENCIRALDKLGGISNALALANLSELQADLDFVGEFLGAAARKLPAAKSFAADKDRRATKKSPR